MTLSYNARLSQKAAHRPTETNEPGAGAKARAAETRRQRGRPKGSKNKAKALIPNELANEILLVMKGTLAADDFEYLTSVIKEGKAVSAEREAKIMLAMLRANLLPAMLEEMKGEVVTDPDGNIISKSHKFRSDVTDRIKVWNSLLNTVAQIEKRSDQGANNSTQPVFEVVARRGLDAGRFRLLIGVESGGVGGNSDGVERGTAEIRTVSDQLPERQIYLPDSEQEPPTGDEPSSLD